MHLPHNNTGLFYYSFRSRTVLFKRHASQILKRLVKPSKELNAVYETESSNCAAWVFPYRAFDFRAVGLSKKDPKHLTMAFENKRFKDGIQGTFCDLKFHRNLSKFANFPGKSRF